MTAACRSSSRGWGTRVLAGALSVAVAWVPWALVWGDALQDAAQAGQAAGTQARDAFAVPTTTGSTLRLFPGTPDGALSFSTLFPGSQNGTPGDFSALFGNDTGTIIQGQHAQSGLLSEDSATGAAYRTLRETVDHSRPDMRLDPLWSQTDDVNTHFAEISRTFADCSVNTTFNQSERHTHVPDYRTCDRSADRGGSCSLFHDYSILALVTTWGGATMQSCGSGCTQVVYRHAETPHELMGNNYPPYAAPQTFGYTVSDSSRISAASVSIAASAAPSLWFQIDHYTERYTVAFDGYAFADASTETFDQVHRPAITMDWTAQLKDGASFTIGNDYSFRTTGPREWWRASAAYTVTVTLWHPPLVQDRGWSDNPQCVAMANALAVNGGFCQGSITCHGAPALDGNGCYAGAGAPLCAGDFPPSPIPSQSPFCTQIDVSADCSGFNRGQMACWTDPQGHAQCPFNEGNNPTDCTPLEQNPQCGFIKSVCVEGAQDATGHCYLHEETWDCGTLQAIPVLDRLSTMDCAGPVRCLGTACVSFPGEQSADFAKAVAALQAAQMAASDMQCDPGGRCVVFSGEPRECKRAVGGIVNCCNTPGNAALGDYLTLVFATMKLDNAVMGLDSGSAVRGAWETLRGPIADTYSAVTQAFSSAANTLMGNTTAAATESALKAGLAEATKNLLMQTAEWTAQVFGDAAANTLFVAADGAGAAVTNGVAANGGVTFAPLIGTVLSVVMWAYTIYQVVMILIKLIWTCEQDEFELGAKRELKACTRVGGYCRSDILGICIEKRDAYCCFNTPLARILNEQIRPQLGRDWGDPKAPDCQGIDVADFSRVDWNQVNLDEWLAILVQTGHFPTLDTLGIDALTGSSSAFAVHGQRANAAQRSTERVDGLDAEQLRLDAESAAWGGVLPGLPGGR